MSSGVHGLTPKTNMNEPLSFKGVYGLTPTTHMNEPLSFKEPVARYLSSVYRTVPSLHPTLLAICLRLSFFI